MTKNEPDKCAGGRKHWPFQFSAAWFLLLLLVTACAAAGQGSAVPGSTQTLLRAATPTAGESSTATLPPELPVKVIGWNTATDLQGNLQLLGEIKNESGTPAEAIRLTLVALDSSGASLLKSDAGNPLAEVEFSPLITRLADGQTAPFEYPLPPGSATPAVVQVFVSAYQSPSAEPLTLQVENTQWMTAENGAAVLVGELVNPNPVAVTVQSLAALLRDSANAPVSAAGGGETAGVLLAAGDTHLLNRAPFKIPLDAALSAGATWQVYSEALPAGPVDTPQFAIDQTGMFYLDANGAGHLISSIKNPSERAFSVQLLAGLYGSTGSVMDVSSATLPLDLLPGEELPFDIHNFSLLDGKPDLQAKLAHYTIQVDPFRSAASQRVWTQIEAENQQATAGDGGVWTFSGSVTNTTPAEITRIVVLATLKGYSTGTLAAVASVTLANPAGKIAPGVQLDYSFEVLADPTDTRTLVPTVKVYAGTD